MMTNNRRRTFTLDDSTYASNPGRLQVNYLRYMRSFPGEIGYPLVLLIIWLATALLVNLASLMGILTILPDSQYQGIAGVAGMLIFMLFLSNWAFWIAISSNLHKLIRIREKFLYGCVNPGIVVSLNPTLVAVFTDLSTREKPHHAIKILSQPLERTKIGIQPVGTKLATVALYEGIAAKGHWDNFHPTVINCVTDHQADIDRVLRSIPQWEWLELEAGLQRIPKRPGLYPISRLF